MDKYISEEDTKNVGFDVSSEFGELQAIIGLMEAKESRSSLIEGIGVGGSILSFPQMYKNRIYFGCCDKNIYCVNLDGKEVWRFSTQGVVLSAALIYNDIIYMGSYDNVFYAINLDGELVWKFATNGKIIIKAAIHKNHVYFGSSDHNLYKLDLNGKLVWKFTTGERVVGEPVFHGDCVFFSSGDGNFYAVDIETGKELWRFTTGGYTTAFPAFIMDNKIFFGSADKRLYALNLDGNLAWKFKCGDTVYPAGVYKNMAFAASRDNNLYAINIKTGKMVWVFKTRDVVATHVIPFKDKLYFGSWDKNLYCLNPKGEMVWKFPTTGFIASTPIIHGDVIYFGAWDCNLYAIDLKGKLVWKFPTSLSYQSSITPAESRKTISIEIKIQDEAGEEREKYKSEGGGSYELNLVQYGVMDKGYLGRKKKGYKES